MIISDGYNGTPSGVENICEDDMGQTKPYVLHAEANAITKVAKSANNCEGATLYITASPCLECSKLIIQAGIKRVVYCEKYRCEDGLDLLRRVSVVEILHAFKLLSKSKVDVAKQRPGAGFPGFFFLLCRSFFGTCAIFC